MNQAVQTQSLEISVLGRKKDFSIYVENSKAPISCTGTARLICISHMQKPGFSHDVPRIIVLGRSVTIVSLSKGR